MRAGPRWVSWRRTPLATAPQEAPPGGAAAPSARPAPSDEQRLRKVQERRAALEEELARLRGEERSLLGEVEQLEIELRLRTEELTEIQLALKRTRARLDATVARVRQLEMIRNDGSTSLTGTVSLSCPHFSIASNGGAYTLTPGQQRIVAVRYAPTTAGSHTCTVETGASTTRPAGTWPGRHATRGILRESS